MSNLEIYELITKEIPKENVLTNEEERYRQELERISGLTAQEAKDLIIQNRELIVILLLINCFKLQSVCSQSHSVGITISD